MRHSARFVLGAAICVLLVAAAGHGQEIVYETSFEEGSGRLPSGWKVDYGKPTDFRWMLKDGRTGARCIRIVDNTKDDSAGMRSPHLRVQPGDRLWASAWFRSIESGSASIYIEPWDASGKRMQDCVLSFGVSSSGNAWRKVMGRLVVPEGCATVTILLYSSRTVTTDGYFDDVTVGRGLAKLFDRTPRPPAKVEHPCGPYSKEDIARARENVKRHEWARKQLETFRSRSRLWLEMSDDEIRDSISPLTPFRVLDCPHCGAAWSYAWQDVGADRFKCRRCGTVFPNAKYPEKATEVLLTPTGKEMPHPYHQGKGGKKFRIGGRLRYRKLTRLGYLGDMGRVYALTGEKRYAEQAVKVMRRLAQVYPDYVPHDWHRIYTDYSNTQSGKISGWKLADCIAFLEIGLCYDLIYHSGVLSEEDKALIENNLFRELGEFLLPIPQRGCCINDGPFQMSAAAMMGVLLGDHRFVEWAVEPPGGFLGFVNEYFFRDGHWSDGSASYESMTLSKLYMLPEILQGYSDPASYKGENRYENLDVLNDPLLRKVHIAPLYAMLPDRRFPPFNDSAQRTGYLARHAEVQNFWYPSEGHRRTLAWVLGDKGFETGGEYALFRRQPDADLSGVEPLALNAESLLRPGAGWAYLRQAQTTTTLVLDYGEPCGWHGHPDRLNFVLYAHGEEVVTDLGYLGARHHFRPWMAHGVCHNLVMVDGKDQEREGGRLICFQEGDAVQCVVAEAPDAYPQVSHYERSMVMVTPAPGVQYVVDVFRLAGGREHDFCFHGDGAYFDCEAMADATAMHEAVGPKEGGYDWLEMARKAPARGEILADWRLGASPQPDGSNPGVRLRMLGTEGDLIVALGPNLRETSNPYEKPMLEFLIQRRQGPRNTFVSVVEPLGGKAGVIGARLLEVSDPTAAGFATVGVRVDHAAGYEIVLAAPGRESRAAAGGVGLSGRLGVASFTPDGGLRFLWMADADSLVAGGDSLRAKGCYEGRIVGFSQAEHYVDVDGMLPLGDELARLHLLAPRRLDGAYRIAGVEALDGKRSRVRLMYDPVLRVEHGEAFFIPTVAWR